MKMHTSEVTSCRCTSSGVGMEQSQFFSHLCSKYQVNDLAAAIQVEQKLLALLRSRWVLKPLAHSDSLHTERVRCLSLQRTAQHHTSRGSRGDLAFLFWPLFSYRCEVECGETPAPIPCPFKKKIYIYMHTRHDNIVLQELTVAQIYRATTGAWIWTWSSCLGVQVRSYKDGSSANPQGVQKCMKQEGPVRFLYVYTHTKGNLPANWHQNSPVSFPLILNPNTQNFFIAPQDEQLHSEEVELVKSAIVL